MPLKRIYLSTRYPYQLDYAEGYIAVEAWQFSVGRTIYSSLEDYPYLVGNYPPLYPLIQAPFFFIFGPSLFWGRLICVLSAIGILILLFFIVWRHTRSFLSSILAPLIVMNAYAFYEWLGYARVDFPAIFFSIAGLAVLMKGEDKKRLRLAALFFLLSVYTKQIQIFAPVSACIYLFLRDKRKGLRFFCWLVGLGAGIFILLNIITKGQYYLHTVVYNANRYDWWQTKKWLAHLLRLYPFYLSSIFLVVATILYERLKWNTKREKVVPDLFIIYAVTGMISVFTIGKIGAAANYLLEFHIALALLFGLGSGWLVRSLPDWNKKIGLAIMCLLVILLVNLHAIHVIRFQRILFSRPDPDRIAREKGDELLEMIRDYPDPILCEQPIFLLLSGKEVLFQPFIMSQIQKEGKWDQERLLSDLDSARFSMIVTGQDMFQEGHIWQYTNEMRAMIREKYKPLLDAKSATRSLMESPYGGIPYFIYVPK